MNADEKLVQDVQLAVRDFKVGLASIGTLSDHERQRIAEFAQHLVADVGHATQEHVRGKLQEAAIL